MYCTYYRGEVVAVVDFFEVRLLRGTFYLQLVYLVVWYCVEVYEVSRYVRYKIAPMFRQICGHQEPHWGACIRTIP